MIEITDVEVINNIYIYIYNYVYIYIYMCNHHTNVYHVHIKNSVGVEAQLDWTLAVDIYDTMSKSVQPRSDKNSTRNDGRCEHSRRRR